LEGTLKDYTKKSCVACSINAPIVEKEALNQFLNSHPDWELAKILNIPQINRVYTFSKYLLALSFVTGIAELAEKEGHHPDILLEYNKVTVRWWSHKIKNIHENDLIMAAKSDFIFNEL
jgi:4a-hydroxytetrahydrobiopterin dehydratase